MRTKKFNYQAYLLLTIMMMSTFTIPLTAFAATIHGSYEGLLFVGFSRVEGVMMNIDKDGNMVFVTEEGDNSDVDVSTNLVPNDIETTALGAWRKAGQRTLEFAVLGFRSGSALCETITDDLPPKLPSCSLVFTGRLTENIQVQGNNCDLGGNGRLARRKIDGSFVQDLGINIDYCLHRVTVDEYMSLVPVPE